MSFASWKTRLVCLSLVAALIGALAGCTDFQTMGSGQWLDPRSLDGPVVSDMIVYWDNQIVVAEDTANYGVQRPGLLGRVFLLHEGKCVEAHGQFIVRMLDLTHPDPLRPPEQIGEWRLSAQALKQLRKKDAIGEGYTLYLPWPNYHPAIKKVSLQVNYIPEKGSGRFSSPTKLNLETGDLFGPLPRDRQFAPGPIRQPPIVPAAVAPQK